MKILLALLLTVAAASAQLIGDTTIYRGDYFGIMIPSAKCSNERLGVDINVYADGELEGLIRNWDNYEIATFDSSWPYTVCSSRCASKPSTSKRKRWPTMVR